MITELKIEGFKSFGSPGETIQLGPLNFVVGANASGKTNLLHALRFLQNAVNHDVSYAVSELGGNAEVRNKHRLQCHDPQLVRLAIKLEKEVRLSEDREEEDVVLSVLTWEYELELNLGNSEATPSIVAESLSTEVMRLGQTSTETLKRDNKKIVISNPMDPLLPTSFQGRTLTIPVPKQELTRLALVGAGFFFFPAIILRDEIRGWSFHNIIPGVARRTYREEADAVLGPAGEKLSAILQWTATRTHVLWPSSSGLMRQSSRKHASRRMRVTCQFVLLSAGLRPGFSPMPQPSRRCCPRLVTLCRATLPVLTQGRSSKRCGSSKMDETPLPIRLASPA